MLVNVKKKDFFVFLSFFLITIGNGKFVNINVGDRIELLGLVLLGLISVFSKPNLKNIKKIIVCLVLALFMSLGAFVQHNTNNIKIQIFITSILLVIFAIKSDNVLSSNKRIRTAANGIIIGCIGSIFIGALTNTLDILIGFDYSIVGILFNSGFLVKNYCGAAWLLVFILYYTYYFRIDPHCVKKHKVFLGLILMLILLSGSKGAALFCLIFIISMNIETFMRIKRNQKKIFYLLTFSISLMVGLYIYNNILSQITTYAYRMRGLSKLSEFLLNDYKDLFFGISHIAYANTGYDYTTNMRNFLGWEASVEMAYVNILIKFGLTGFVVYIIIFYSYIKKSSIILDSDKQVIISLLLLTIISGFVEAYISTIHYIMGPTIFCLINGIIYSNRKSK